MTIQNVLASIDRDLDASLARLFELLKIRSISTDPAYKDECAHAAQWLARDLKGIGFDASVRETTGNPMVVAHAKSANANAPHVLFYGHYDVQPVDPLELWQDDPFAPKIVEAEGSKRIVARGAADDKGQLMAFVEACRAFMANGGLPCHVSILFEGEEECGSLSLPAFLAANAQELKADAVLVCDTNMWDKDTPAITTMLRGLVLQEVVIDAASRDLHSGMYGGAAANPVRVLARIIAGLHDAKGRVTIPGFYDGVEELPQAIRDQWQGLAFDPEAFLGEVGLAVPAGEAGRSVLEMIWSRPTCEVNGIAGGYAGAGFKTVLPAEARAKISFRLVGTQDPLKIREAFRAQLRAALPADCTAEFAPHGASPACRMDIAHPAFEAARIALGEEWGMPAAYVGCGGSIPVAGYMKDILGLQSMLIGFGRDDDRIHSPNEKYDLDCFRRGARSWARILAALR